MECGHGKRLDMVPVHFFPFVGTGSVTSLGRRKCTYSDSGVPDLRADHHVEHVAGVQVVQGSGTRKQHKLKS